MAWAFLVISGLSFSFMVFVWVKDIDEAESYERRFSGLASRNADLGVRISAVSARVGNLELLRESVEILNEAVFANRKPSERGQGKRALVK